MSSNIKKQFLRVSQKLDQTLGRAEKTEVLDDKQQELERQVELIHKVSQTMLKKLQACLSSQGIAADAERRMKKISKAGLSHCLIESAVQLGLDSPSGKAFQLCGDAEGVVAMETLQLEVEIENQILHDLSDLVDVQVPNIQKLRKQLTSRTLDMDSARARYGAVYRQAQAANSGPSVQTKLDSARDEVEDSVTKVDQTRDQLATEMYQLVARQSDLNQFLLALVELEVIYHQRSLEALQRIIPNLQQSIEFSRVKPVFGVSLEDHLHDTDRQLSLVIEQSITALRSSEYDAVNEEGLFRVAGSTSKMKKLRAAFNATSGPVTLTYEEFNPHVIASVLKQYLRELPEPLMTFDLYFDWLQVPHMLPDERLPALHSIVSRLPLCHRRNLAYVIKFLSHLSRFSNVNKMSASNIAVVVAPNLLWARGDPGANVFTSGVQASVVELLISNADVLFPDNYNESNKSVKCRQSIAAAAGDTLSTSAAPVSATRSASETTSKKPPPVASKHSTSSSAGASVRTGPPTLTDRPHTVTGPPPLPDKPTLSTDRPARDTTTLNSGLTVSTNVQNRDGHSVRQTRQPETTMKQTKPSVPPPPPARPRHSEH